MKLNRPKNQVIPRVTFDFETQSKSDLKKEGAYKYSLDPSTRPTCLAAKIKNGPLFFLDFYEINYRWEELPEKFRIAWTDLIKSQALFVAHNAFFERCIYTNILVARYGWPKIPFKNYRCTAAKAASHALPRSLEKAAEVMELRVQKDKAGYIAMMKTCKPTREWKRWNDLQERLWSNKKRLSEKLRLEAIKDEPLCLLTPNEAPEVFKVLYQYCKIDVLTEEQLDESLPDLNPEEQEIWHFNQTLNWRGLRIDIPTVKKITSIMEAESRKRLRELDTLTMGLVTKPNSRKSILEFLALEGIELPNLRKETVEDKLSGFDLSEDMRRLLEIRKALSLASTKKYQSFLQRACDDGRVRDILLYHGASTGRDTGTGVQPHNFPRGIMKVDKDRPYAAVENVSNCSPEILELLYGDSLPMVFSSILRNMIIPSPGYELFVADYSKIEVAVLWWAADNKPGLKVLREGKDPYIYQASANTNRPYESFFDDSPERQLGKAQVLGCGFGMGWEKFLETAIGPMYRLKLTEEQAKNAVQSYRQANKAVPELWKNYEHAAISAVEKKGSVFKAGKCSFFVENNFLYIELPSKRRLAYKNPQIIWRETEWGSTKALQFEAVNSKTKKWGVEITWGGKITENIVQAIARDLMMPAMLRLEKARYRGLLMVHDEGICERKKGEGSLKEFTKILCQTPSWGSGLPIDAKGWIGERYRK